MAVIWHPNDTASSLLSIIECRIIISRISPPYRDIIGGMYSSDPSSPLPFLELKVVLDSEYSSTPHCCSLLII